MARQSLNSRALLDTFRTNFNNISSLLSTPIGHLFRRREQDFSRLRILSPQILVILLLYMVADAGQRGYKLLLRAFWDECRGYGIMLRSEAPISGQAFCAAREKLKPALIRHLVQETADEFERERGEEFRFRGFRLLAIDGLNLNLNRSDELFDYFGSPTGGHCPQALVSALYNVLSGKIHGVTVAPQDASERTEAIKLLPRVEPGDVLVADRGYPSFDLIEELKKRQIHFVLRMPKAKTFKEVERFVARGRKFGHVTIRSPARHDSPSRSFVVRIAVFREFGEDPLVLITDLEKDKLTRTDLARIYKLRWKIEELYGLVQRPCLDQRQFHSKKPEGIEQEILSLALFVNLVRTVSTLAADQEEAPPEQICEKEAVLTTKAYLTRLLLFANSGELDELVGWCLERIGTCRTKPRPGRSYPRVSYKPGSKWGASGKRGKKSGKS